MIMLRNKNIGDIHFGDKEISKIYKGTTLVYQSTKLTKMPVILYDNVLKKNVCTSNLYNKDVNRYTPIGIVVIPASHNVYGTGECGVVALRYASTATPDEGTDNKGSIYWGSPDYSKTNSKVVPYIGTMDGNISDNIEGVYEYGYLPVMSWNIFKKFECPHDKKASYYGTVPQLGIYPYASDKCVPSPYLNDESRNPNYYTTDSPSSIYNALSDFAGKSNTEFFCSEATSQPNWKTDAAIENKYSAGYYPAACSCWRYHTLGTNQGDWYLPAGGELGYIAVRHYWIAQSIKSLRSHFGMNLSSISDSYWSSSESYGPYAFYINVMKGYTGSTSKDRLNDTYVRPFLRGKFEVID